MTPPRGQVLCVWGAAETSNTVRRMLDHARPEAAQGSLNPDGEHAAHPPSQTFIASYDWREQTKRSTLADWRELAKLLVQRHPGCDLLLIEAGVDVPADWHQLLACAYRSDDRIGAVCPLTDALPWLSPFDQERPAWMGVDEVMHWLQTLSRDECFDIPALWPGCVLVRAEALPAIAGFDQPLADSAPALQAAGWSIVACDWLFAARPPGTASPAAPALLEPARLKAFTGAHPLGRLRHGFGEAGARGPAGMLPARPMRKPVQLHITHNWGGGLERWLRDYCETDEQRWNLVLRPIGTWGAFGQKLALYRNPWSPEPLREWIMQSPIASIAATHLQYRHLLHEIIDDFQVDAIIVSSLVGHSLDVFDTTLPTLWVAHDYVPFCPALVIHHESVCHQCGRAELQRCERENPLNRFFKDTSPDHWLTLRQRFIAQVMRDHVSWVAPSASVGRHYRELVPTLRDKPLTVIGHGTDPTPPWQTLRARACEQARPAQARPAQARPAEVQPADASLPPSRRLRIVVLGSLAPQKGRALLSQAIEALARIADLYLIGCGDDAEPFRAHAARLVPRYAPDELPALLAEVEPDLGLLLSTVPETFSYTLSELWQAGIVPVATRLGGFADRISDGVDGFLFEPDAQALLAMIETLGHERARLVAARAAVCAEPARSRAQMVADYHRLLPLAGRPGTAPALLDTAPSSAQAHRVLRIDPNARFGDAVREFIDYTIGKLEHSPRLGAAARRALLWPLRRMRRRLG
ncbi:MAG: glycosyltransferase family 4 protein [Burkholderiales bacterium]|nr:glycosyltransferase family 4 protein [Burkholderiales bacterium]